MDKSSALRERASCLLAFASGRQLDLASCEDAFHDVFWPSVWRIARETGTHATPPQTLLDCSQGKEK